MIQVVAREVVAMAPKWPSSPTAASPRAAGAASIKQQLQAKTKLDLDGCGYELVFSFEHDDTLPSGASAADGADRCTPPGPPPDGGPAPPLTADDGLPYFVAREFYFEFPTNILKETGFAGIGLDYQPCGHPPAENFGIEHYDMHFYTTPSRERLQQTCNQPPGAPICIPDADAQTTNSGRAFFNVATVQGSSVLANMPANSECKWTAAIPAMGTHCWDFDTNPDTPDDWADPVLVMGSYDGGIAFFEPMTPLSFVTGDQDNSYGEDVDYVGQTISTLPYQYSVEYEAATGRTTVTLSGMRSTCGEDI